MKSMTELTETARLKPNLPDIQTSVSWLVFSDDWGRHPSSCQHLFRQIARYEPVVWVNTIGSRAPRLDRATVKRGLEKLREWFAKPRSEDDSNPRVIAPIMWPWMRRSWDRVLNQYLLRRSLLPVVKRMPRPRIGVATVPIVADVMRDLPVDLWVYYCVDDWSTWLGWENAALDKLEQRFLDQADAVIAVSERLQEKMARHKKNSMLLTHGVDWELWTKDQDESRMPLASKDRQVLLQWGLIDQRLDASLLRAVATALPSVEILLVGPVGDEAPQFSDLPQIRMIPPVPYAQIPALAKQADVLIMAYRLHESVLASNPLKLKEYMLSGKPVVVPDLPAARPWADALDIAGSHEEFVRLVKLRLQTGLPDSQRQARRRLEAESWRAKANQFRQFVMESWRAKSCKS